MRKLVILLLLVVLTLTSLSMNVYAASYSIYVGGKALKIPSDMGSVFLDSKGRTQVPVRALSEALDCEVAWDAPSKTVTITRPDNMVVTLKMGSVLVHTGLGDIKMDTVPKLTDGRVSIPVRFAANALGYSVDYKNVGGVGNIIIAKSDKQVVGDLSQPEPVYDIYRDVLGANFRSTMYSAACVDLDMDGVDELIVIQAQNEDFLNSELFAFVYKKDKLVGKIDLGYPPPSEHMQLWISTGEDGRNYLDVSSSSTHQGWQNNGAYFYGIENGAFKLLHSADETFGPKNDDWESGEWVSYISIDGRSINSEDAYTKYIEKYSSLFSLGEAGYEGFIDKTSNGRDIYLKAEEEYRIKIAENQSLKDSKLRAGLKELIGLDLFEFCDEDQLIYLGEVEGAYAYICPVRDDVTLFVSGNTLQSVYIEYVDDVIPVFGLKIGESKRSDVKKIFGHGMDVDPHDDYFGNPPGWTSCTIYNDERTSLMIYYNSDDTVIAAFVNGLQM